MKSEVSVIRFSSDGTMEFVIADRGTLALEMQVEQGDARSKGRRPGEKVVGEEGYEFGLSYDRKAVLVAGLISEPPARR